MKIKELNLLHTNKSEFKQFHKYQIEANFPVCHHYPLSPVLIQFVPFRDYIDRSGNQVLSMARLAKDVLAEIPDQLLSFMKSRGIEPQLPLPATSESPSMSTTTTTTTAAQKERKMHAWSESGRSSTVVRDFSKGKCVFVSLCVYVRVAWFMGWLFPQWIERDTYQKRIHSFESVGGEDCPNKIWTGSVESATIHKIKCSSAFFLQSSILTFQMSDRSHYRLFFFSSTTSPAEAQSTSVSVTLFLLTVIRVSAVIE